MKPHITLLLAITAIAFAQDITAPAPLSSEDRLEVVAYLRQQAHAKREFAWQYDAHSTIGGQQFIDQAEGIDIAADMVERWVATPAPDPIEERHEEELIVINLLRAALGLPPREEYPEP